MLDVNVKGTFYCCQAAVPHMVAAGGGAIVNTSSIGGRQPSPVTGVPYAAAKAAIVGLTKRLAREVGPQGVRVNAIAPGLFLTDRLQGMFDAMADAERQEVLDAIPLGRMPELREIVDPMLFLASRRVVVHHRRGARRQRRPLHAALTSAGLAGSAQPLCSRSR